MTDPMSSETALRILQDELTELKEDRRQTEQTLAVYEKEAEFIRGTLNRTQRRMDRVTIAIRCLEEDLKKT